MKQIEVHILQQSYLLSCPEGHESRLLEAVERVDTAMTRIRDAGKVRARERCARGPGPRCGCSRSPAGIPFARR